jgi:hypothetical protein
MSDKEQFIYTTPIGRLINQSLFERDVYKDEKGREGDPMYKAELAFDSEDDVAALEDVIVAAAVAEWGAGAEEDYYEGRLQSPIKDGDVLAAAREKKGKKGDAYAGKQVIRASTKFNANGDDDAGGVHVAGPNGQQLQMTQKGDVYAGCMGRLEIEAKAYAAVGNGLPGVKLYLRGFQIAGEGERLRSSTVGAGFTPVEQAAEGKGRRQRTA